MKKIFKKADIVFLSLLSAVILCVSFAIYFLNDSQSGEIVIEVENNEFGRFYLDEYQEIDINGTNTLKIDENGAQMIHADCPDKVCLNYAPIKNSLDVIICLPNEIVVYLDGDSAESELDVVVN